MKLSAVVLLINGGPAFRSTCLPVGRLLVAFVPHFTVGYLLQLAYRQAGPGYSSAVNLFSTFISAAQCLQGLHPWLPILNPFRICLSKINFPRHFQVNLQINVHVLHLFERKNGLVNFLGNAVAPPLQSSRHPSPLERERG